MKTLNLLSKKLHRAILEYNNEMATRLAKESGISDFYSNEFETTVKRYQSSGDFQITIHKYGLHASRRISIFHAPIEEVFERKFPDKRIMLEFQDLCVYEKSVTLVFQVRVMEW